MQVEFHEWRIEQITSDLAALDVIRASMMTRERSMVCFDIKRAARKLLPAPTIFTLSRNDGIIISGTQYGWKSTQAFIEGDLETYNFE